MDRFHDWTGEQIEGVVHVTEFQALQDDIGEFADSILPGRPVSSPLNKLREEVEELIKNPTDDMEFADCLLVLLDAYRAKGGNTEQLLHHCREKMKINRSRNWGTPDANGVFRHIEETEVDEYPNPLIKNVKFIAPDATDEEVKRLKDENPNYYIMRIFDSAVYMPFDSLASH